MSQGECICAECKHKVKNCRTSIRFIDFKIIRICYSCWTKHYGSEGREVKPTQWLPGSNHDSV